MLSTWVLRGPLNVEMQAVASSHDDWHKATQENHPCNVWLRESHSNVKWLYSHLVGIIAEYDYRFGEPDTYVRIRRQIPVLRRILGAAPNGMMTPPALVMPEEFRRPAENMAQAVEPYRAYYLADKLAGADYKIRERPHWFPPVAIRASIDPRSIVI